MANKLVEVAVGAALGLAAFAAFLALVANSVEALEREYTLSVGCAPTDLRELLYKTYVALHYRRLELYSLNDYDVYVNGAKIRHSGSNVKTAIPLDNAIVVITDGKYTALFHVDHDHVYNFSSNGLRVCFLAGS